MTPDAPTKRILAGLIAWNLIDIAVHVAADEVEVLRVSANLVLIIAATAVALGRAGRRPARPLALALIAYVPLNLVVMVDKGPAAPMITFIVVTVVLTGAAIHRLRSAARER